MTGVPTRALSSHHCHLVILGSERVPNPSTELRNSDSNSGDRFTGSHGHLARPGRHAVERVNGRFILEASGGRLSEVVDSRVAANRQALASFSSSETCVPKIYQTGYR